MDAIPTEKKKRVSPFKGKKHTPEAKQKMSDVVLKAYLQIKKEYTNIKLAFVGNTAHADKSFLKEFKQLAEKDKSIKYFVDFVPTEIYEDFLYAADLGIQLRNTSNGQVSGALSDNISAKLYTLASFDLVKSINSPSYIVSIDGVQTVDKIITELKKILQNKKYQNDFSEERDEYLKEHNFENYINILLKNL